LQTTAEGLFQLKVSPTFDFEANSDQRSDQNISLGIKLQESSDSPVADRKKRDRSSPTKNIIPDYFKD